MSDTAPKHIQDRPTTAVERVRLAWVLVGPSLRPVAEFVGVPAAKRPPVTCPVCGERVILKLGAVLAPHAAHRSDSRCPLQHEETALHYNTKHHLAGALRAAAGDAELRVRHRCRHRGGVLGDTIWTPGLVPCEALRDDPFVRGWDAVEVEAGLSDTRPDILLRRGGEPAGVIEVRRTHAVTSAKIERLAAAGVPWVEVVATRALYDEFTAWTADAPLTVLRSHALAGWACEYHRGREARRARDDGAAGAPWAARVVDRYLPNGQAVRELLFVSRAAAGGRSAPALWRRHDAEPVAVLAAGSRRVVLRAAHAAFLAWAAGRRAVGERIDSPMSWLDAARLRSDERGWSVASALFPRRYAYDRAAGAWRRRRGVGNRPWALAEVLTPTRARRVSSGRPSSRADADYADRADVTDLT